jgi:hypothetical protein
MAQESINYGSFPNDPSANTVRDAFIVTQNNFTQLFTSAATSANVAQIVAGAGISVSPANGVGNVTVTANLNSLKIRSNTLSVSSLGGYTVGNTIVIPDANATLLIELSSVANSNSSVFNLDVVGNLTISGNSLTASTANINLTSGNITLGNGKFTGKVAVAGGNGAIQFSDANGVQTGNSAFYYDSALTTVNVPVISVTQVVAANANIVSANFANVVANSATFANASITGTLSGNVGNFSSNVISPTFVGNLSGNLTNPGLSNAVVFYNASGVSTGSANLRYISGNLELTNGSLVASSIVGNLTGTASLAAIVTGTIQSNITELGNLSFLNVSGSANVNALASNSSVTGITANFTNVTVSNTLVSTNINSTRANIQTDVIANNLFANSALTTINITSVTGNFTTRVSANAVVFNTQTVQPSTPAGGTVYYNGITGKLQVYNGVLSIWEDLN